MKLLNNTIIFKHIITKTTHLSEMATFVEQNYNTDEERGRSLNVFSRVRTTMCSAMPLPTRELEEFITVVEITRCWLEAMNEAERYNVWHGYYLDHINGSPVPGSSEIKIRQPRDKNGDATVTAFIDFVKGRTPMFFFRTVNRISHSCE